MTVASSDTITLLPLPFSPRQRREFQARLLTSLQTMSLQAFAASELERLFAWKNFTSTRERRYYRLLTHAYSTEELARWIHLTIQENLPDAHRIDFPSLERTL